MVHFLLFSVVLDRRENRHASTGDFELAFKDNPLPNTKCVETKFLLEGQRIRRGDLAKYNQIDQKLAKIEQQKEKRRLEKELGISSPAKKQEVKEDKEEQKDYLAVNLYGGGEDKENEKKDEKEQESTEETSARDTNRSQKSSRGNDKPPTAVKRSTTSAKLDKIEQILKQSPYNNPKPPPPSEKQKKAK